MNEIKISNCYETNYYKTSLFVVAKLHIDLHYMENKFRDKQIVVECREEFLKFVAWLEIDLVFHTNTSDTRAEDFWDRYRIL